MASASLHHLAPTLLLLPFLLQASSSLPTTFCGDKPNGLYPDPQNCYYFWKCWGNGLKGSLLLCPPNTIWSQASLTCINSSNCTGGDCPSLLNDISSNCNHSLGDFLKPFVPIWSWNGLLHCYGEGCANSLGHSLDIGVPCLNAQELLGIAEHYTSAWIPAPHDVGGDLNMGSQHWKISFDSLEKEAESGLTWLTASIRDYSPSQKILASWQGGPEEAQFVLKGPLTSPEGRCYYGVTLEKPDFNEIWEAFTQALIKESMVKGGEEEEAGWVNTEAMSGQMKGELFKRSHKRRSKKKRRHHNKGGVTVQGCLKSVPWAGLLSTALCYASNSGGGINHVGACSDFSSSTDLSTVAACLNALTFNQGV